MPVQGTKAEGSPRVHTNITPLVPLTPACAGRTAGFSRAVAVLRAKAKAHDEWSPKEPSLVWPGSPHPCAGLVSAPERVIVRLPAELARLARGCCGARAGIWQRRARRLPGNPPCCSAPGAGATCSGGAAIPLTVSAAGGRGVPPCPAPPERDAAALRSSAAGEGVAFRAERCCHKTFVSPAG